MTETNARRQARGVNLNPQVKAVDAAGTPVEVSVGGRRNPERETAAVKAGMMDASLANYIPESIRVSVGGSVQQSFQLTIAPSGDVSCPIVGGEGVELQQEQAQNIRALGALLLQAMNSKTNDAVRKDIALDIAGAVQRGCGR